MRAKILFVTEQQNQRASLRPAQQALSAIAIAFGHSFMMREITFDKNDREETLSKIRDSQGVAAMGSDIFFEDLCQTLSLSTGIAAHLWPEGILGISRLKDGNQPKGKLVWPAGNLPQHIEQSASIACGLVKAQGGRLLMLPPKVDTGWQAAVTSASAEAGLPQPLQVTLTEAMDQLLGASDQAITLLTDAIQAAMIDSVLHYLNSTADMGYTNFMNQSGGILAVKPGAGLFAVLFLCVELLGSSLGLIKEAECLRTAISNVLANARQQQSPQGAPSPQADGELLHLVEEQVALVGEMFERLSGRV